MKRYANSLTILSLLLGMTQVSLSQTRLSGQPCPDLTLESFGCELIVWSNLQGPAQLPDPMSLPDQQATEWFTPVRTVRASDSQARWRGSSQTIVGVIIRTGGRYSLRAAANVFFGLDDQVMAKSYEGKPVRATGTLDADCKTLHVKGIKPIS